MRYNPFVLTMNKPAAKPQVRTIVHMSLRTKKGLLRSERVYVHAERKAA